MNEAPPPPAVDSSRGAPPGGVSGSFSATSAPGSHDDRSSANGSPRTSRRVPWGWLAKFTLGFALLAYILRYFDFHDVWQRIESANRLYLAAAFGLGILQSICFSLRWRYLASCTGANLPVDQAIIGNFELSFFSQFVPTAVAGDVVRIIRAQRSGLTLSQSVTSIFLDRAIGLTTIVFFTPLMFALAPHSVSNERLSWAIWGLNILFAGGLIATYFIGPAIETVFGTHRIVRLLVMISEAFRTLVHSFTISSFAVLASIVGYALTGFALMAIAAATSVSIGFSAALLAICLMTLATFIPISIGGWGVREGAGLLALGLFAVSPQDALAISILFGLVTSAIGMFGGVVWMFCGYSKPAEPH